MKKKREGDGVVGLEEEGDSERRHQSVYIWGEQIEMRLRDIRMSHATAGVELMLVMALLLTCLPLFLVWLLFTGVMESLHEQVNLGQHLNIDQVD